MEVSSADPPLMAMDLSKSYSVTPLSPLSRSHSVTPLSPLSRAHSEALDLGKKPEWYHRRPPPSCSTEMGSSYRSRASSSYDHTTPVHCRELEQRPESLTMNYMNSTLAPGLDLYRDGVHGNLWHSGFYGDDQSGGPILESSGGEDSDSGSDVIFLVSSAKEPLLCTPFIQDSVRHIVEPLSPAVSSLDGEEGCYLLPQPMSSPSPNESSYSDDSSDSSVDIPVQHTRPVVLLSDLTAVYNASESPEDISSDDSDVIEVSFTDKKKKKMNNFSCKKNISCKKSVVRETPPQSEDEKAPPTKSIRRSNRIRKSVSDMSAFTAYSPSRYSLRRQAKNDAVGLYNESGDSDEVMEFAARLCSSEAGDSRSQLNDVSDRVSSISEESGVDVETDRKSEQRRESPRRKASSLAKSTSRKLKKKPAAICKTEILKRTKQKENSIAPEKREKNASAAKKKTVVKRRKRRRQKNSGPQFPFIEPEIQLKYAKLKEKKEKRSGSFKPFVHLERRKCVVVNDHEEEATVRSSTGGKQHTRTNSMSGFLPHTSCFQLGRYNSEEKCPDYLLCSLCGQTANAMGLGDLHGPYHPTGPYHTIITPSLDCKTEHKEEDLHGHVNSHSVNSSYEDCNGHNVKPWLDSGLPKVPPSCLDEVWIHEDCGIWSAGVFLVRGKLYGLEEAARIAQETVCASCQRTGAIIGCFQKGCSRSYHYRCAIQSGCALTEENFSIRCPEHKNKTFTTRKRKR